MKRLKLAVIGTGALGKHHARILSTFADVELVAVVDTNPVLGQAVALQCRCDWVADYRQVLDDVDAAVVAVPTFAHYPVAQAFLERRLPLLVEKPLAAQLSQAQHLAELADQHQTLLQVGHVERFNPALQAAWPHLQEARYIRCERYSPYSFRSTDIGVVHDVMIHDLDVVAAIVQSPVVRVEAFGMSILGGEEDCVQARLVFANGCIADLSANRVSPVTRRHMQVWSQQGCVDIDFAAREVVHYAPGEMLKQGLSVLDRARQPGANLEQMKSEVFGTYLQVHRPAVAQVDQLTEELRNFVDCIRTGNTPVVDAHAAVASLTLADLILRSVAAHRWDQAASSVQTPVQPPLRIAG